MVVLAAFAILFAGCGGGGDGSSYEDKNSSDTNTSIDTNTSSKKLLVGNVFPIFPSDNLSFRVTALANYKIDTATSDAGANFSEKQKKALKGINATGFFNCTDARCYYTGDGKIGDTELYDVQMYFHSGEANFFLAKHGSDSYDISKPSAFETIFGDGFTYAEGAPLTLFAASASFSKDMPCQNLKSMYPCWNLKISHAFMDMITIAKKTGDAGNKTYLWRSESASKTFQYHYNDYSIY